MSRIPRESLHHDTWLWDGVAMTEARECGLCGDVDGHDEDCPLEGVTGPDNVPDEGD